jgi:hypothetical protein
LRDRIDALDDVVAGGLRLLAGERQRDARERPQANLSSLVPDLDAQHPGTGAARGDLQHQACNAADGMQSRRGQTPDFERT